MEVRWVAASGTSGRLGHHKAAAAAARRARKLPSAEGLAVCSNICMSVSLMSVESKPLAPSLCLLISCDDNEQRVLTDRRRLFCSSSRGRGLTFASTRAQNPVAAAASAAPAPACRRALRLARGHGLSSAWRCAAGRGFNGIADDKMVQTKRFLKMKGLRHDHFTRLCASGDSSSSSQPAPATSPPSSSSSTTTAESSPPPKSRLKSIFAPVLSIPSSIWRQIVLPLSNFGFGKTSIWEGGVGIFVISGFVLFALAVTWVRGVKFRSKNRRYEAVIEFSRAQGIMVGTPVRIRGVDVGTVVGMRPSLEKIDVVVQLADIGICIPRNALVEVNQSGLISETLIDVTPRDPIPRPTLGPLEDGCSQEGLIVCDKEKIKGEVGVSLDELVGICTKLAKQVGDIGVGNVYSLTERIAAAIDEAKPLLAKAEVLAGDVEPLLKELKDGVFLKDLERLTRVVAEAGDDLRVLNKSVLTAENTELLRQSVVTLTKTLSHIESISQDVSGVTGDAGTKKNLRQLIESLSRLVMD